MNVSNWSEYDEKMLEAFVAKPEKMAWYRDLYDRCYADGFLSFKWKWSWWAFLSNGVWFLLYRKTYLAAAVFVGIALFAGYAGLGIGMFIVSGGVAPYFVLKQYIDLKALIESKYDDEAKRIEVMRRNGGCNDWTLWVALALNAAAIELAVYIAST
ncbi:MAG: DUF2628 domain-containing protein [Helicobacteraceae bacterium]|jgi:hypothetical protein|nr:DUF2628 domain-containing protein [Helicobacteraceae bacterium]